MLKRIVLSFQAYCVVIIGNILSYTEIFGHIMLKCLWIECELQEYTRKSI